MADVTVRAVQTDNRAVTGLGVTPNGVVLADGDYVLNVAQMSTVQNGVWIVREGAWERPEEGIDYRMGFEVRVKEGNGQALSLWLQNNDGHIVDTDSLTFQKESTGSVYVGGAGISVVGSEIGLVDTGVEEGLYEQPQLFIGEDGRISFASTTGISTTYCEGLAFEWNSQEDFLVRGGAAYVPAVNRNIVLSGAVFANKVPGGNALTHVYLYEVNGAGAIETSAVIPDIPYGVSNGFTSRTKLGDETRRYLGTLRNDASGNLLPFHFELLTANVFRMTYVQPFAVVNGFTGSTSVQQLYVGMDGGDAARKYIPYDISNALVQWQTTGSNVKHIGYHPNPAVIPTLEIPASNKGRDWIDLGPEQMLRYRLGNAADTITISILGYWGKR